MAAKKTLYDILGLDRDANPIDIGLAYEKRSGELSSAMSADPNEVALVRQAYEVLSSPERRAAYDAALVTAAEKEAAASQAQAPDLVLEPEPAPPPSRKLMAMGLAGVAFVALLLYLLFATGPDVPEAPAPQAMPTTPAPAPPPPPPPPPKPRSAAEILAAASTSVGLVMSYRMSGQAVPAGLALATEPGSMITTCHGLPAGAQIVVRIKGESHSAQVAAADEELNLCRLSIAEPGTSFLAVSPHEPRAGDRIHVLGANAQGELALTEGTIRQVRPVPVASGKVYEISVPIAPTANGGAVFDTYGRLVGIAVTPHDYGANLQIAVPARWIGELRARNRKVP